MKFKSSENCFDGAGVAVLFRNLVNVYPNIYLIYSRKYVVDLKNFYDDYVK